MTTTATLVQLAAELTLFLVALAGVGLSARHGLLGLDRPARVLLVLGFAVLAVAAFLVGSLTVDRADDPVAVAAIRVAGSAIVALGALRWAGSRVGRPALLGGLALLVAAAVADAAGAEVGAGGVGAEPLVLGAAAVVGAGLVVAGRHTIPGRIGTSVAGVLLAVILLVSVALSTVISATVEDEALRRSGVEAAAEADAARREAEVALDQATLVAASLAAGRAPQLVALDPAEAPPAERDAARAGLTADLEALVGPDGLAIEGPVVVVGPTGAPEVAAPSSLGAATRLALGGDPVAVEARELDAPRQGVTAVGQEAFALAAAPLRTERGAARTTVGVAIVARPLDATFLRRQGSDDGVGRALVTREGVVAEEGDLPAGPVVAARAADALAVDEPGAGIVGDHLVVARPVASEGLPPEMALVRSTPTDRVGRTREDIYRSLFLVALVAGLAGVALATLVGERIGGGIRRLTAAAARIREGDLDARAALEREDELGELSTTFDAMAGSVRTLTDDLRAAATAEAGLRSRLETVFAGVADAVVAADGDGRVTELNPAAARLLGRERGSVVGADLDEVVVVRGPDGEGVALDPGPTGTRPVVGEVVVTDGEPVAVAGTVAELRDDADAAAGRVVVLRDVRSERALEAARRDFLATIGHELRTPLTPIKGYAGVLRRRAPTAEQARAWAGGITEGVTRLEHLVDRLVALSALTASPGGRGRGPAAPVDLGALVEEVGAGWRDRLDGERRLVVSTEPRDLVVPGDRDHLRLAVDELVDNAVRFSPPGTLVRLVAALEDDDERGPVVALTVHDAGGADAARLEAAVGAFRQGDASTTRARDGLGLGLALTARVAATHGGRLRIVAPSPEGTSVSILLPVASSPETAPVAPSRPALP